MTLRLPFRSTRRAEAVIVFDASENGIVVDVQWESDKAHERDKADSRMFIQGVLAVFGGVPELTENAMQKTIHSDEEAEALRELHLNVSTETKQ